MKLNRIVGFPLEMNVLVLKSPWRLFEVSLDTCFGTHARPNPRACITTITSVRNGAAFGKFHKIFHVP